MSSSPKKMRQFLTLLIMIPLLFSSDAIAAYLDSRAKKVATALYTSCTVPDTVALTFDDGPYYWETDIVDMLDNSSAKGTFFVNGNNCDCIYDSQMRERVKYAYDHGHMIASHTWRHLNLTNITYAEVCEEIDKTGLAIQRITGALVGFMRPPYGSYDATVLGVAANRSLNVVTWDFDSKDGLGYTANASKSLYDEKIKQHPSTILTLNHEIHNATVFDVLPYVIPKLQAAGYKLVTVAECLGLDPYQSVDEPEEPDDQWKC